MITSTIQGTYTQVHTMSIVQAVESELRSRGLDYQAIGASSKQRKQILTWRLPDVVITDGDSKMNGQIYLRNSEIPGTALTLLIGAYRFICTNGLVIGAGEGGRVIHRTGPRIEEFLQQVPVMIRNGLVNLQDELQDTIDLNRAVPVSDPISVVASLPIQKTVKDTVIASICTGRVTENVQDQWGLYNYINEVTRKHSRSTQSALTKDIGLLDHIQLLNQCNAYAA
jgi:hypothetical protein